MRRVRNLDVHVRNLAEAASTVRAAWETYRNAIVDYDAKLRDAGVWRDAAVGAMERFAARRPRKWRETDAGAAYQDRWLEYSVPDLDELEADYVVGDEPKLDHADQLANLSVEHRLSPLDAAELRERLPSSAATELWDANVGRVT